MLSVKQRIKFIIRVLLFLYLVEPEKIYFQINQHGTMF